MRPLVSAWELRVRTLFPDVDVMHLGLGLSSPSSLLHSTFSCITRIKLDESIRALRSLLHGRSRQDMRNRMNLRVAKIEQLRIEKKLGKVIRLLGDKEYTSLDLSTLRGEDGETQTTPSTVADVLDKFFGNWFAVPDKLDPAALEIERSPALWKELAHPPPNIQEAMDSPGGYIPPIHEDSKIPKYLQDGLRRACRSKATPALRDDMQALLAEAYTLEEFKASIKHLSKDKAPGPSMVNSNMIKAWDDGMVMYMHSMMQALWEAKKIPVWFKDHILSPLPKIPGNTELKNMRPISLFEIIRKIWTGMVVTRIQRVWTNHNILHSSQHGFRWKQGTDTALLRILDALEDARENNTEVRLTLWDLRRAFDSVSRNFLRMAWTRLGVPDDCVTWLTGLDEGGKTYVSSPHLFNNLEPRTMEEMLATDDHFIANQEQGFTAIRGVGQGDSSGPLCWIAVFDILLCWTGPGDEATHPPENPPEETGEPVNRAGDMDRGYEPTPMASDHRAAYADDLADCVYSLEAQRRQALWVSAFCAATGLEISVGKIVTVILNAPHSQPGDAVETMTIYDSQWQPHEIDIEHTTKLVKYLGVEISMDGKDDEAYQWAVSRLSQAIRALDLRKGDGESKMQVLRFSILPKILYRASKANWRLSRYQELDRIMAQGVRKFMGKWNSYSTELIFLPVKQGGIGVPRISDLAQEYKWSSLQRALTLGGAPGRAARGLIERAARRSDITLVEGQPFQIPSPNKKTPGHCFIDSLLEWAHTAGLTLQTKMFRGKDRESPGLKRSGVLQDAILRKLGISPAEFAANTDLRTRINGIFTDGSFKLANLTVDSLLVPMGELRRQGEGGAAIVLMGTPNHWRTAPLRVLRIVPATVADEMDAFTAELIGITLGTRMAEGLPHYVTLYSDCKAAIARGMEALCPEARAMGHLRNGPMFGVLRNQASVAERLIKWIKAHPERRMKQKEFGYEEWGSFLADAAAEGNWDVIRKEAPHAWTTTVVLEDIMDEILPEGEWHWRDESGRLALNDIGSRVRRSRGDTYKKARDDKRTADGRPPFWQLAASELAAYCDPTKHDKSFRARFANTNVIFDTIPDGRKQALGKKTRLEKEAVEKCPICEQKDSQWHRLFICDRPEFKDIREKAHKLQLDEVTKIKGTLAPGESWIDEFASATVRVSWNNPCEPERLWTGNWDSDTIWRITRDNGNRPITTAQLMSLRKIIRKLTIPLRLAGQEINSARALLLNPEKHWDKRPKKSRLPRRHRTKQRKTRQRDKSNQQLIDQYTVILPPILRRRKEHARKAVATLRTWYRQKYLTNYFRPKRGLETLTHYRNVRQKCRDPQNEAVVNGRIRHEMSYVHIHNMLPDTDDNP
jgi:hypothetical protein